MTEVVYMARGVWGLKLRFIGLALQQDIPYVR
jgi:hypothetical protein